MGAANRAKPVIEAGITVGVLGEWPTLRTPPFRYLEGFVVVTRCPLDPNQLRSIVVQVGPAWLILGNGVEDERLASLARLVQLAMPSVRLLVLGSSTDLERHDRWLARGAKAYLQSTIQPAQAVRVMFLADELDLVIADESFSRLRAARQARLRLDLISQPSAVTRREREVLGLLRLGMRNNAIGVALRVSESTVEFHVSNILAKLGAATRTEAVDRATALGMY